MRKLRLDEQGMILPLALMALAVLAVQSAALLAMASSEVRVASNHLGGTQAYFLAEAAVEDAFAVLRTTQGLLAAAPAALAPLPGLAGPGPTLAALGTYSVRYQRGGPNTVQVVATATTASRAERIIRATMSTHFTPRAAVLTRGDLTVGARPTIRGRCGSVHANGNLAITGTGVEIEAKATASGFADGTYSSPSSAESAQPRGSQPRVAMPEVSASAILSIARADATSAAALYILTREGRALQWNRTTSAFDPLEDQMTPSGARAILHGINAGWQWTMATPDRAPQWRFDGDAGPSGTFIVEGDVAISSRGSDASWHLTLIARDIGGAATSRGGNIMVDGTPRLVAHLPGILFASERDIVLGGTPVPGTTNYTGLVLAREQIKLMDAPSIHGAIIAADVEDASPAVTSPGNQIAGNAAIRFDCDLNPPLTGPLAILAWGR